jgi:phosphoribosylaminoimidazolecarboxamide formyltransferase/IMP cyclohydrolase
MNKELLLRYGCNPNQTPANVYVTDGELPFKVLNGSPGYINMLDALNGWQLVSELEKSVGVCSAASFKHVSPAGVGLGLPLTETLKKACFIEDAELSPIANAYARARGSDRVSSYGDFIALSDICDITAAKLIQPEVSDGIIAPGYTPEALELLKTKKKGRYIILSIDRSYNPPEIETKQVFGVTFRQRRNDSVINYSVLDNIVTENRDIPDDKKRDLVLALITLKYTQSNSVCFTKDGGTVGVGAGQQSRIHCTRLAGNKADIWYLRQSPQVLGLKFTDGLRRAERDNAIDVYISEDCDDILKDGVWQTVFREKPEPFTDKKQWLSGNTGVCIGSDAFFPFGDNIERAYKSGVLYAAQPGGSVRDDNVIDVCNKYGIAMAFTGLRLFHH